jgi:hypothetical protein
MPPFHGPSSEFPSPSAVCVPRLFVSGSWFSSHIALRQLGPRRRISLRVSRRCETWRTSSRLGRLYVDRPLFTVAGRLGMASPRFEKGDPTPLTGDWDTLLRLSLPHPATILTYVNVLKLNKYAGICSIALQ